MIEINENKQSWRIFHWYSLKLLADSLELMTNWKKFCMWQTRWQWMLKFTCWSMRNQPLIPVWWDILLNWCLFPLKFTLFYSIFCKISKLFDFFSLFLWFFTFLSLFLWFFSFLSLFQWFSTFSLWLSTCLPHFLLYFRWLCLHTNNSYTINAQTKFELFHRHNNNNKNTVVINSNWLQALCWIYSSSRIKKKHFLLYKQLNYHDEVNSCIFLRFILFLSRFLLYRLEFYYSLAMCL